MTNDEIFNLADELSWVADYMEPNTGKIYHISTALNHDMIPVSIDGKLIEIITRKG